MARQVKFDDPNDCPPKNRPRFFSFSAQKEFQNTKVNKLLRATRNKKSPVVREKQLKHLNDLKKEGQISKIGTQPESATVCPDDDLFFTETKNGFKCCLSNDIPLTGSQDLKIGDIIELKEDDIDETDIEVWDFYSPPETYFAFVVAFGEDDTILEIFFPPEFSQGFLEQTETETWIHVQDDVHEKNRTNPVKMSLVARLGPDYQDNFLWKNRHKLPLII